MRILIIGGTGFIGRRVTERLLDWGADLEVLCRSASAAEQMEECGARPLRGDMRMPEQWIGRVPAVDAAVQVAGTFDETMGEVDRRVVTALLERWSDTPRRVRFLYTAGVWLYGDTQSVIDESAPYQPPQAWHWFADQAKRLVADSTVEGLVVHPANVVDTATPVPAILLEEARNQQALRVPAPLNHRLPLVERTDLAELYALLLDRGQPGTYLAASEAGVPLAALAEWVARHLGWPNEPIVTPLDDWQQRYGNWASGYGLDQQVSSAKARALGWEPVFRFPY